MDGLQVVPDNALIDPQCGRKAWFLGDIAKGALANPECSGDLNGCCSVLLMHVSHLMIGEGSLVG